VQPKSFLYSSEVDASLSASDKKIRNRRIPLKLFSLSPVGVFADL
jgi:hypothetical protein